MKVAVIITTKNEADTIANLISQIEHDVIVVDENSSDRTAQIAQEAGAFISLPMPEGFGIGPCLMAGWYLAMDYDYTRIVQIDAGGSHDPGEIDRLLMPNVDVVIGSRFMLHNSYHGRPLRAFMSRAFGKLCNVITGAHFRDWTSGYRAFSRHAIDTLAQYDYHATMHGWQAEVLSVAHHAGLSILEVPITYRAGRSSFNRRIALEAMHTLWHIAAHKGAINANRIGIDLP